MAFAIGQHVQRYIAPGPDVRPDGWHEVGTVVRLRGDKVHVRFQRGHLRAGSIVTVFKASSLVATDAPLTRADYR